MRQPKEAGVKVTVAGGGAGGAAAVVELVKAGHGGGLGGRTPKTLGRFGDQGGVPLGGFFGPALGAPPIFPADLEEATADAELVAVCAPTLAHEGIARG